MSNHTPTKELVEKMWDASNYNGFPINWSMDKTNVLLDKAEKLAEVADEHAAVMAVAFAEWIMRNCKPLFGGGYEHEYRIFLFTSDLYQYFINNVYNK